MMYMVLASDFGSTASTNTSTPMPPTQWVKLRQKRMPWVSASTSVRMLAPVVVKPDTVSKNASTNRGICPLMVKGRAPNRESRIQLAPTIQKPSLAYMASFLGLRSVRSLPTTRSMAITMPKGMGSSP